ncbi:MAG TPA: ribonuclease Z [Planctomycetota bacterium]|nr:ribonuclease Z [Planctomycetota bacterium]
MKLTFLGTSAAAPTRSRNTTAVALQLDQRSDWWLFDCGEGTQHQVMRSSFTLPRLSRIFVSHLHGDHCFGLPGLLATRGLQSGQTPVDLYGPAALSEYLNGVRRATGTHFQFPVTINEVRSGEIAYEDDEVSIRAVAVQHGGPTFAWILDEKPQAGRFRIEEAQKLNIPPGPVYAKLKAGETVTLADGRTIDGKSLVDPPRTGRKLALVFDTCDASALAPFAQNADLLLHEATFLQSDNQQAKEYGHSTGADAARFAAAINAKRLVLSHFSSRYEQYDPAMPSVANILAEAQALLPGREVIAAKDFLTIEIQRPQ